MLSPADCGAGSTPSPIEPSLLAVAASTSARATGSVSRGPSWILCDPCCKDRFAVSSVKPPIWQAGGGFMGYTLAQFSDACHRALADDPSVEGRKKVCALVQEVLKDDTFVATHLGDEVPERKVLYEDRELGFCILAHVNQGARESKPHDHGPSWAIYGQ